MPFNILMMEQGNKEDIGGGGHEQAMRSSKGLEARMHSKAPTVFASN